MLKKFAVTLLLGASVMVMGMTLNWSPAAAGPSCEACD